MSALTNSRCPVCRTAEVVCGKWTLLVIRDLAEGPSRFGELERSLEGMRLRNLSPRRRRAPARRAPVGPIRWGFHLSFAVERFLPSEIGRAEKIQDVPPLSNRPFMQEGVQAQGRRAESGSGGSCVTGCSPTH